MKPSTKRLIGTSLAISALILAMGYGYWTKHRHTPPTEQRNTTQSAEIPQPKDPVRLQPENTITDGVPSDDGTDAQSATRTPPSADIIACTEVAIPAFTSWINSPHDTAEIFPYLSDTGVTWYESADDPRKQEITQTPYLMELGDTGSSNIYCEASTDRALWLIILSPEADTWKVDEITPNTLQALNTEDR